MIRKISCVLVIAAALTQVAFGQEEGSGSKDGSQIIANTMKLTLKNKLELEGSPVDIESIKINSLFGEISVPVHTIAGIRFAQGGNEQTTVVLLNGDALTGEINMTDIKFVSEWGEAKVNVGYIVSIVFRPDLSWSSVDTPNGRRFRLQTSGATSTQRYQNSGGRRFNRP